MPINFGTLLSGYVIEKFFSFPLPMFSVCTLPWETLRPSNHKFSLKLMISPMIGTNSKISSYDQIHWIIRCGVLSSLLCSSEFMNFVWTVLISWSSALLFDVWQSAAMFFTQPSTSRGSDWECACVQMNFLNTYCELIATTVLRHYIGQPALGAPPVKNWSILLVQSFTAHMSLLTETSAFGLGRRHWNSQQCYLYCLHICELITHTLRKWKSYGHINCN